jgi:hypothetical protein
MEAREKRLAKKGQLLLPLRAPQIKPLYDELYKIKDDIEKLRQIYYTGRRIPRKKKTVLVEVPAEQVVAKK